MKALLPLVALLLASPQESKLSDYFPPPEEKGGWRTLLPESGAPDAAAKAKIREVANPDGQKVGSFAEGISALKKGKINYEGASSALDFDATGDVKPTFGAWSVESGKLVQKYKFQA